MNKFRLFLIFSAFSLCVSCDDKVTNLQISELKKEMSISQLSDSTYLLDIRSLFFSNGKLYATDYKRDQFFILNDELELQKTMGQKGRGPGEFLGASNIFVNNDLIYIFNDNKRTFELYDSVKHLETIELLPGHRVSSDIGFTVYNNEIYFSSYHDPYSISKFFFKLDSTQYFGNSEQYRSAKERRIKNSRHLHVINKRIIAIPDCQPFVELYSMEGKFINSLDLSSIRQVDEMLRYVEKQNFAENTYSQFFSYTYSHMDKLYILLTTVGEKDEKFTNTILELEIDNDTIIPLRLLKLEDEWYDSFCVSDNKIYAYSGLTAELVRYAYE